MRRSLEMMTVTRSTKKKMISPMSRSCKSPMIQCPRVMRVMPPRIQLVTGMIAKMMLRIQGNPKLRYPFPCFAIKNPSLNTIVQKSRSFYTFIIYVLRSFVNRCTKKACDYNVGMRRANYLTIARQRNIMNTYVFTATESFFARFLPTLNSQRRESI